MKTLTQLYKQNTLEFGFEEAGITLVENHKVSYKTIQALGKIMTDIRVDANGTADTSTMIEVLMGRPSNKIKTELIKGLGSHYDRATVQRTVKRKLEDEGEVAEEDMLDAITVLMDHFENAIVAALFNAYLEKQNLDAADSTPR